MSTSPVYPRLLERPKRSAFLFGARGVGKSTWLRQHFAGATVVDLLDEALYQRLLADVGQFASRMQALPQASWVVVDEVQRLPYLLNEVHRFIESRQLKFILSGSSARKLRRAGTNLLAGRAIRREMFPLLPAELGAAFDLEEALRHGTLPLVWGKEAPRDTLEAYVQTYLREEIQAEALVRNLPGFARFLPVAALFHGQVLNAASLARDAGVARSTIVAYLEVLEDTLLAFRLAPYEGRLRVKEAKHPKLYWVDAGVVRAARRRLGPVQESERGALFEGLVAAILRAYRSMRRAFDEWYYWAPTASGALEVDFLLWRDGRCVAIEVKASHRLRQEHLKGLRALADAMPPGQLARRLLVYLGDTPLRTPDDVDVLPFASFLTALDDDALFA